MSTAAKTITTAKVARRALPASIARRVLTSPTTRRAVSAAIVARILDPTGKRRAARRRRRLMIGAAASGALLAVITTALQRRRSKQRSAGAADASSTQGAPRTAGTTDVRGNFRSRHGEGAGAFAGKTTGPMPPSTAGPRSGRDNGPMRSPLDSIAAHAEQLQNSIDDEPGYHGHLGFGVGGSIPADRVGGTMPTGGGDALGDTLSGDESESRGGKIITGAGEAITNSTTRSQNGKTIH